MEERLGIKKIPFRQSTFEAFQLPFAPSPCDLWMESRKENNLSRERKGGAAYLHLTHIRPLAPGIALNRLDRHVEVILVGHGNHIAVGHVLVANLDLETTT